MELIIFAGIFFALAVAALLWGVDSIEGPESREWANRKEWYGKVAN